MADYRDDRAALHERLARLEAENDELREENRLLREPEPAGWTERQRFLIEYGRSNPAAAFDIWPTYFSIQTQTLSYIESHSDTWYDEAPPIIGIELYDLVAERKETRPEGSYTSRLFNEGIDKIVKKLGEEAVETIIAAKNESSQRIVEETADLLYHLVVTLVEKGVTLEEIQVELQKRKTSGKRS